MHDFRFNAPLCCMLWGMRSIGGSTEDMDVEDDDQDDQLPDISQVLQGQLLIPRDPSMDDKYLGVDEMSDGHPPKHLAKELKHELVSLRAASILGQDFSLDHGQQHSILVGQEMCG